MEEAFRKEVLQYVPPSLPPSLPLCFFVLRYHHVPLLTSLSFWLCPPSALPCFLLSVLPFSLSPCFSCPIII